MTTTLFSQNFAKALACVALFSLPSVFFGQDKKEDEEWVNPEHTQEKFLDFKSGWFVGGDLGGTLFYGDVALYNYWPKYRDYSQSIGGGYSIYGGKKIIYGLAVELQYCNGKLMGQKRADNLYPRYFKGDFMDYSVNVKYNLSQQLFRKSQHTRIMSRLSIFGTAGGGQVFFRSRLYKLANNDNWYLEKAVGYNTVGVDSAGITSAGGLVTTKKGPESAIIVPIGAKINYKLNARTDITLDIRHVTAFTDRLDGWERTWSHKDKYMYIGVGFTLNIGKKDDEDMPKAKRFPAEEDEKTASATTNDSDIPQIPVPGKKSGKKTKSDRELELKLKMYELQLMIFEMQYLMMN